MTNVKVAVTWQGIALADQALELIQAGQDLALIGFAQPMPVGAELTLSAQGESMTARVAQVIEAISGRTDAPGMVVTPKSDKASWWPRTQTTVDGAAPDLSKTQLGWRSADLASGASNAPSDASPREQGAGSKPKSKKRKR